MSGKSRSQSLRGNRAPARAVHTTARTAIKEFTRLQLFVRAGGRCEFPGCNRDLLEHHLTTSTGNYAQMAHIVAYSRGGPRADSPLPKKYLNDVDNLMLLCPGCHKEVDDNPVQYPVARLRKAKAEHEDRIHHVTGLSGDLKTDIVRFTAKIGDRTVSVPLDQITKAVEPYYPRDRKGTVIDLTALDDRADGFLGVASQKISSSVSKLAERSLDGSTVHRLAVFALGPIPLLIHLGRELSDKVNVDLYQRHRDTEDWSWKMSGTPVSYVFRKIRDGTEKTRIALSLSLSGSVDHNALPAEIDQRFTIYDITLDGQLPNLGFLRLRADLEVFAETYRMALREMDRTHGHVSELHLFPAVPAPIAVLCGRALLPKVDPTLLVYDADKKRGGFSFSMRVN